MALAIYNYSWNGAAAAALALLIGRFGSNGFLWVTIVKARSKFAEQ
jgi:hypothetical protein